MFDPAFKLMVHITQSCIDKIGCCFPEVSPHHIFQFHLNGNSFRHRKEKKRFLFFYFAALEALIELYGDGENVINGSICYIYNYCLGGEILYFFLNIVQIYAHMMQLHAKH